MCGRFGIEYPLPGLAEYFEFDPSSVDARYVAHLNIAPTSEILAVRASDGDPARRVANFMRWGLIPHWAQSLNPRSRPVFNARSETVDSKPMFRVPFARRRCIVPASGFYEWTGRRGNRVPTWIHPKDVDTPIGFAAIWNRWQGPDGTVYSCSIITTAPNQLMRPIHDRMPVILDRAEYGLWLDSDADAALAKQLLDPREWEFMEAEPADPSRLRRK